MSIPPLVCSTPPPPEQCEDDRDHEDFDLQYNSSQEDYDEQYDYGNFSTYNKFEVSNDEIQIQKSDTVKEEAASEAPSVTPKSNAGDDEIVLDTNETNIKCEEEVYIEDLNLKLDDETLEPKDAVENESESSSTHCSVDDPEKKQDIPQSIDFDTEDSQINELPIVNIADEIKNKCSCQEPHKIEQEIDEEVTDLKTTISEKFVVSNNTICEESKCSTTTKPDEGLQELSSINENVENTDEDFGDFEDFNFSSNQTKTPTVIDSCDNPWDNNGIVDNNGFGDFKANFEHSEYMSSNPDSNVVTIPVLDSDKRLENINTPEDDFGDFDDFQSSSSKFEENEQTGQQLSILNLQESEAQILERINKIIKSLFEEELVEPEDKFDVQLDSLLGVTWGHLLETDVRQPYIVSWNNSVAQKTLLKSLCIDSRNILFGPKWNYNMPKYAANLTAAPLQPQKQSATPSSDHIEPQNADKQPAKAIGSWSDSFKQDGQESCNIENTGAVVETGPTDLDVFEAAGSSKIDKVFSNTISIQPIRQINLPDTHIFTPTDSETPRSKKIHYDHSPTMLMPHTVLENKPSVDPSILQPNLNEHTSKDEGEDNDWEFQDFKGPSENPTSLQAPSKNTDISTLTPIPTTSASVTYGTQVLQPIKVEPVFPTLNWPDPGEVKETFDDFSDFISSEQWSNDKTTVSAASASCSGVGQNNHITESSKESAPGDKQSKSVDKEISQDNDFDTFQSALPPMNNVEIDFNNFNKYSNTSPVSLPLQSKLKNISKFDNILPSTSFAADSSRNSDTSTTLNHLQKESALVGDSVTSKTKTPTTQSINPLSVNMLQPTPATFTTFNTISQQKSAQILQPLSLEGYSQMNWPNPGIDLQDLSRFNPVETLQSLKSDLSVNGQSKGSSPVHAQKTSAINQPVDEDIWGEFVSSKPVTQQSLPRKPAMFVEDDEWTDFVSSPSVKPQNGLNTISLNVHTNLAIQKSNQGKFGVKMNQLPLDIPSLNYITPNTNTHKSYNDKHFQNL